MSSHSLPLLALLGANNHAPVEVLPLISDLLRNIRNLARIGGPKVPVVPPLAGRGLEPATTDFLAFFRTHYLTTPEERAALQPGEIPKRRRGQRFHVDEWLCSTAILLKASQARLAGAGTSKRALVNRYLAAPGRWQNRQGLHEENLKDWGKKGKFLRGEVWTPELAAILTSLALPDDLPTWPFAKQKAHLRSLKAPVDAVFAPHTDEWFAFEIVGFFFDFGRHTDEELKKSIRKLRPMLAKPRSERFLRLLEILLPAWADVHDLLGDVTLTFTVPGRAPI